MNQRELENVINNLVTKAQRNPGVPQRYTLQSGLRLDVLMHHGLTQLQLSKEDEFPTTEDYRFVLNNWPFQVDWPEPKAVAHSGRKYLTGDWLKPSHPFSESILT